MDITLGVVAQKLRNVSPIMACLNHKLEEIRLGNGESRDRLSKILRKTIFTVFFLIVRVSLSRQTREKLFGIWETIRTGKDYFQQSLWFLC